MLAERRGTRAAWMPINVHEEGGAVVVTAAVAGLRPEDLEVQCAENVLTLRARSEIPEHQYLHQELRSGEYQRQVALPVDCRCDEAEAGVENGLLTVRVPKVRPQAPEKIRIRVNRKDSGPPGASRPR